LPGPSSFAIFAFVSPTPLSPFLFDVISISFFLPAPPFGHNLLLGPYTVSDRHTVFSPCFLILDPVPQIGPCSVLLPTMGDGRCQIRPSYPPYWALGIQCSSLICRSRYLVRQCVFPHFDSFLQTLVCLRYQIQTGFIYPITFSELSPFP